MSLLCLGDRIQTLLRELACCPDSRPSILLKGVAEQPEVPFLTADCIWIRTAHSNVTSDSNLPATAEHADLL